MAIFISPKFSWGLRGPKSPRESARFARGPQRVFAFILGETKFIKCKITRIKKCAATRKKLVMPLCVRDSYLRVGPIVVGGYKEITMLIYIPIMRELG